MTNEFKIIVDTREKKWEHIKAYFEKHGVGYELKKLNVGDYQIDGKSLLSVDRKQNLSELSHNLMNRADHSRFWKEVRRAKETKTKLIILCEHGGKIKSIRDVAFWSDKYSGVSGRVLMEAIYRVHISYGVEFIFCDKRSTGRKIVELLTEGLDGR